MAMLLYTRFIAPASLDSTLEFSPVTEDEVVKIITCLNNTEARSWIKEEYKNSY